MKTFLKVAAIVAATLPILAGSAHAIVIGNGVKLNGWGQNGIKLNGWGQNGIKLNGWGQNGVSRHGTVQAVEGLRLLSVQLPSS